MELGQKLKEIRQTKRITLQRLADGAGLSKSFISQIESGVANPSIASLKKIADVLDTPLAALFDSSSDVEGSEANGSLDLGTRGRISDVRVVRRDKRKMLVWPGSGAKTFLLTPDLQRKLEVILSEERPGETSGEETYSHSGEEFGFVLQGRYEVAVEGQLFVLEEGDSIYYPSHLPHKTRVLGDKPATTLWVITPPSF